MTLLFELKYRPGGDPTGFAQYGALHEELSKLAQPASPEVNWEWVEYQCLSLFKENGAELQSAAAFLLARMHLHGLSGMEQALALVVALLAHGEPVPWPPSSSARAQILAWLCVHLQSVVRRSELSTSDLLLARRINAGLTQISELLGRKNQPSVSALEELRQQFEKLIRRLEPESVTSELAIQQAAGGAGGALGMHTFNPFHVANVLPSSTPNVLVVSLADGHRADSSTRSRKDVFLFSLLALLCVIVLGGLGWWGHGLWLAMEHRQLAQMADPEVVHLDSLMLFPSGSAQLRPESTKVLINSLMNIKAQQDWLIVITGHSDAVGNVGQNLELSLARAAAVRDWMQRMGDIPDSCFVVQGFGAGQPLASNDTEEGRSTNRRVDIRLVPQAGACATGHAQEDVPS
ncbi:MULTISPECIES: OmpA family protein [unclassified Pseudomonas]|uniref:OmpA family protein n=1 Tax=unclassified Pseudomonas TaxID=196821 RepID=UPI000EA87A3E|nr:MULTISPECIES: OmpA family protein [unclassified Pseudomonas]AYF86247.1 flagellar motor protein MotB [Pseudomonas sp. DY-1]MDH4653362.1 flagellar motor protein MotB [Pseudomonas sp. BN606]MRK20693.1 OmpA family protein [Pseudomonas sp. JG-B]